MGGILDMEMVHATMTSTAATLRFISLQFF